ncbi:MAG: DMT family transporter [Flavobacteriales bacterium]|nr:DMT family transporter [Flavobacteriales bacterium]MDG1797780.1 DMT family transporter [Flavobacteriales bacterium]
MLNKYKYHFVLHFTILIWGFTGIIGKTLNLSGLTSNEIVFWRMLIAWATLLLFLILKKEKLRLNKLTLLKFFGNGGLIALHWYFFFEAIALSNVSIALVFMSTTAFFTSFAEWIVYKKTFDFKELLTGLLVIVGISIIVNDLNYNEHPEYLKAVIFALTSALLAAFFSVINSVLVKENKSSVISFYELFFGFLIISSIFLLNKSIVIKELSLNLEQFYWLLILGVICTSFAFLLGVYVMKFISAYTVNLSVNLEPIYAIIFALLVFKDSELMNINFYFGSLIVVGSILLNAFFKTIKKAT